MPKDLSGYSERTWIKLYDKVLDDRDLQSMPAENFRFLVNCWLLARRCGPKIGTPQEVAFKLRMSDADAERIAENLKDYFKVSAGGMLEVEGWEYWQGAGTSSERVKAHRERRKGDVTRNVTGATPNVTAVSPPVTHEGNAMKRDETHETFHPFHETRETFDVTRETLEEKRKEEKRTEKSVTPVSFLDPATCAENETPEYWSMKLIDLHPKPSARYLVEQFCSDHWHRLRDAAAYAAYMGRVSAGLAAWCRYWEANGTQYAPALEKWLSAQSWEKQPPAPRENSRTMTRLIDLFPEVPNASE